MKFIFLILTILVEQIGYTQVNIQIQPDGKKYSKVILNGPVSAKYDIVFIGDGFTLAEQSLFNAKVGEAVDALSKTQPYASSICSFNIWRVNVISKESGISSPNNNIVKNTELDCYFGDRRNGQPERCIYTRKEEKCYEAAQQALSYDVVFVLVNEKSWGGTEGGLVFSTIANGFSGIITHELGHKIAQLGDEYSCLYCDRTDDEKVYNGPEPVYVNLTIQNDRTKVKWKQFILASTKIPTDQNNPLGVVGLFEGGGYAKKRIYRPQYECLMENVLSDFCMVCNAAMKSVLRRYCNNN